jgi:hypothetical protein
MKEKLDLTVTPIWNRQPGETATQYMWFTRYMEERIDGGSLSKICTKYKQNMKYLRVLQQYSYQNRWVERIEAYRDFLETEKQKQRLKDIESMNDRQSSYGKLLQQIAMQTVHDKIQKQEIALTPEQIVKWVEAGVKIERTARGSPTEIQAIGELPEEIRQRMESIYRQSMTSAENVSPELILKRSDGEEEEP